MKRSSLLGCVLMIIGLCIVTAPSAFALTIAPMKLELKGDPGQVVEGKYELFNEQNFDITFYSSFQNFEANDEGGSPTFVNTKEGLATWMSTQKSIVLKAGQHADLRFKITIPKNAEPGGYFAAIFLGTTPPPADGQTAVSVGAKTGILILLTVSGDIKEGGGLVEFSTENNQRFFNALPVKFTYRFQNSGGDRMKPLGDITIKDMAWLTTDIFDANENSGNILPRSARRFVAKWNGAQELEKGETKDERQKKNDADLAKTKEGNVFARFWHTVGYQWEHFAMGMYTARLHLTYGSDSRVAQDSYIFFVLPWQLMLVMLVGFTLLFFGLRFGVKRYNRWIIRTALSQRK